MAIPLKQSTASQEILLGPFLDETDGVSAETGLTIANTDIKLWKQGGTSESNKNSGGATHIASGRYYAVLDGTDTDTLGSLIVHCAMSGALPVRTECVVLPAVVYDALIAGTDRLEVDVLAIAANVITSTAINDGAITSGKLASGAITAAAIATDAIDADALATDAVTEIASATATAVDAPTASEIAAEVDAPTPAEIVAELLATQVTEAYPGTDDEMTLAEALWSIRQLIGDFSITGTALVVRDSDGNTAMTYTLDHAVNPTSRTRNT